MTKQKKKQKKYKQTNNAPSPREQYVPKTADEQRAYLKFLENLADKGRTFVDPEILSSRSATADINELTDKKYETNTEDEGVREVEEKNVKKSWIIRFFKSKWFEKIITSLLFPCLVALIVTFFNSPDKKIEKSEGNIKDFVKSEIASSSKDIEEMVDEKINNYILANDNFELSNNNSKLMDENLNLYNQIEDLVNKASNTDFIKIEN